MSPGTFMKDCERLTLNLLNCSKQQREVAALVAHLNRGGAVRHVEAQNASFGCQVTIYYPFSNGNALAAINIRLMEWATLTLGRAENVAMSMSIEQVTFLVQLACSPKLLAGKRGLVIMALLSICDEDLTFKNPVETAELIVALAAQLPDFPLTTIVDALRPATNPTE